jgi:hypothetical protein
MPCYREIRPSSDLRAVVACRWVRVVRLAGRRGPSAIIPDGCADIMAYDDAPANVAVDAAAEPRGNPDRHPADAVAAVMAKRRKRPPVP